MKIYEVAVLGGGFSGLVSAIILSDFFGGENVLVLEKNDRVGKKILATGNGRGNVTNSSISAENYHSSGAMADVANTLEKYGNKSIIAFFRSLGVPVTSDGDRIYPASLQANSLLDSMRAKLGYLKTDIGVNAECQKIEGGRGRYVIRTMEGEYAAKRVILATGGKAGKQYGTDGSAFEILKKHGVKITPLSPAIVQLKTETEWIKGLKGLKEKAFVTAYDGEKPIKSFFGDVLFTDYGVSGNAAFYLSSYLVGAKNPQISISFTGMEQAELADFLKQKIASLPYVTVDDVLSGVINKQIGKAIVKRSGVKTADERSMEKIARIAKDFRLKVVGTLGFDYAQVTRGGVAAEELGDGFELKKLPGVYVAGEATDIDGDCGGYNLQWAYSSARAACDKIIAAAQ
ncbi:MAG: aminoacetone oxidase family FAD-binding enzyme [Clostridia bacterium]|nr:aminoacetone oxidase family FAD-binding enzyme [Clostridia bacterium]MDY2901290.1 aminoacetone oxidase family FAD-binding enzyme [Christensenellaceae bacterium]